LSISSSSTGGCFTSSTPCTAADGEDGFIIQLGIPWTPVEFFDLSLKLVHPFAVFDVDDAVAYSVFFSLTSGPEAVIQRRRQWFEHWEARAEAVRPQEETLCAKLHPRLAKLALSKRPILLREMLVSSGFAAADLCYDFLVEGVPMFGPFPATGVFPARRHAATLSLDDLTNIAKWAVPAVCGASWSSSSTEVDQLLAEKTREELERGECCGPFSRQQLNERYPQGWLAAKRFPVLQKGTVRACDDYAEYGHNNTSDSVETVDTGGIDAIIGVGKLWSDAVRNDGSVRVRLRSGKVLVGPLHPSLVSVGGRPLRARLVDLRRAYKQLAVNPKQAHLAIFAVKPPGAQEVQFFEAHVLGFGARNAVLGFNLFARALRHVLTHLLMVTVTHFFDDFSQVDIVQLSEDTSSTITRFFDLMGWQYKDSPEDLRPPAALFAPLGVMVDFSSPDFIEVSNTAKRIERVAEEVDRMCDSGSLRVAELHSLIGVAQFSEAQTLGRCGSSLLRRLRSCLCTSEVLSQKIWKPALIELKEYVATAAPRKIWLSRFTKPVLIFVDAAAEGDGYEIVTIGAVLFDPCDKIFECFGCTVANFAVNRWRQSQQMQVIGQAEICTIPVALETWRLRLANRNVLIFVDNDSAKDAMIRGDSKHPASAAFVDSARRVAAEIAAGVWYARVASPSNIADAASRGDFTVLKKAGARLIQPLVPARLSDLLSFEPFPE
jgi:hypothetical protein